MRKVWTLVIVTGPGRPARQIEMTPSKLVALVLASAWLTAMSMGLGWWLGTLEADYLSSPTEAARHLPNTGS